MTVAPGLYELNCGLYSNKSKPYFEVIINGMSCLAHTKKYLVDNEENTNNYSDKPYGKDQYFDYLDKYGYKGGSSKYNNLWQENDESKNRIVGHSISTYVNLPANSRVYVSYKCDDHAEGFLCLRKI